MDSGLSFAEGKTVLQLDVSNLLHSNLTLKQTQSFDLNMQQVSVKYEQRRKRWSQDNITWVWQQVISQLQV